MCYEIVFAALSCHSLVWGDSGVNEVKNWRKTKFEYSRGENREKPKQTSVAPCSAPKSRQKAKGQKAQKAT